MNTKKRIRRLERDVSYLQNCIDALIEKDPIKIAMIYSARQIQKTLENEIFKGDGKNT